MIWNYLSAAVLILTALAHSIGGFRSVLSPLLNSQTAPLSEEHAILLQFAWHGFAALAILSAAVVAWPETPRSLLVFTGLFWIALGIADIITSKFAHPGWIPMGIAGVLAIIGAYR